jgi:methylated-DNA-protein-cysteine methyltransferase-like protein
MPAERRIKKTSFPPGTVRLHGEVQGARQSAWDGVYKLARRIPRGKVMTYGQIATLLGSRLSPRAVGWALHGCPRDVPWHRVVNAAGGCSTERLPDIAPRLQRTLLEREGVSFGPRDTLDLRRYRWTPRRRSTRSASSPRRGA